MSSLCPLCNERPVRPTSTTGICTTCEFQRNLLESQRRSERDSQWTEGGQSDNSGGCLTMLMGAAMVGYLIYYCARAFFHWLFG